MGTTQYYQGDILDSANGGSASLELGTTGFAGAGPQVYLNLNSESVLLSHADAKRFFDAVEIVRSNLGY